MKEKNTLTRLESGNEIVREIRNEIHAGNLKPGDKLCGMTELAAKYSVSVYGVRHAIRKLKNLGLVYSIPKNGIFISEQTKNAGESAVSSEFPQSEKQQVRFGTYSFLRQQRAVYEEIGKTFDAKSLSAAMKISERETDIAHKPLPESDLYEYSVDSVFYQEESSFINLKKYFTETIRFRDHAVDNTGIPLFYTLPVMIYNKKILKEHGFGEKPEFHDYDSMTEFMDAVTTETACCADLAMPGTNVNMLFRLGQNLDGIYHDICNFSMTEKEFYEKYSEIFQRCTAYWKKFRICYPRHTAEHLHNIKNGKTPFFFGFSHNYLPMADDPDFGAAIMFSHDNTVNGILTMLCIDSSTPCLFDTIRLARHFQTTEFQEKFAKLGLYPLENELKKHMPFDNAGKDFEISKSISREFFYMGMNIVNVELWNIVLFEKSMEEAIHDILFFSRSFLEMNLDHTTIKKQRQWADIYF